MKYSEIIKKTALAITVLAILSSCVSKRKIAEMTKTINEKKTVEKNLETKIASMDEIRVNKTALGELDDKSNESIKKVLDKEKQGVVERTSALDKMNEALTAKKRIKIKDFETMQVNVTAADEVVAQKSESINFVNQLLKQTTFVKFNSAAFFEGGGFKIPENKMEEAKTVFSPIVDSLVVFVKRFPKLRLNSSIIASGYADATGFGPGALVDMLTSNIGKAVATKEELNSELSRLRAEEVAGILTNIYNERIKDNPNANQFNTQFFKIGKGEELPNKKITNYEINDERRRIVVIYWNALPE